MRSLHALILDYGNLERKAGEILGNPRSTPLDFEKANANAATCFMDLLHELVQYRRQDATVAHVDAPLSDFPVKNDLDPVVGVFDNTEGLGSFRALTPKDRGPIVIGRRRLGEGRRRDVLDLEVGM